MKKRPSLPQREAKGAYPGCYLDDGRKDAWRKAAGYSQCPPDSRVSQCPWSSTWVTASWCTVL